MIKFIVIFICVVVTFGMALLQLSLVFKAPFGEYVLGGQHRVLPKKLRFVSASLTCFFILVGFSYLSYTNIINIGIESSISKTIIIQTIFLGCAIYGNGVLTKSRKKKL